MSVAGVSNTPSPGCLSPNLLPAFPFQLSQFTRTHQGMLGPRTGLLDTWVPSSCLPCPAVPMHSPRVPPGRLWLCALVHLCICVCTLTVGPSTARHPCMSVCAHVLARSVQWPCLVSSCVAPGVAVRSPSCPVAAHPSPTLPPIPAHCPPSCPQGTGFSALPQPQLNRDPSFLRMAWSRVQLGYWGSCLSQLG